MNREDYQKVKKIFHSALDLASGERAAFLAETCREDKDLHREVQKLLDSFESDYLEQPAIGNVAEAIFGGNLAIGQSVGRYKICEKIGVGGMGEVFLAEDTRLKRKIALKILPAMFGQDKERLRRFEREARAASALNHPNILTIHEFGVEDGTIFIASEFVKGETLRERLSGEPINFRKVLDIVLQIAAALNAAHESGIVHRDIKPENIMIREDGLVKVLDFGLAKLIETKNETVDSESETLAQIKTTPGLVMGTVNYMSPEQARGKNVDARTDIFSFGVMIYEMLSGKLPFKGENEIDILVSILHEEPALLGQSATGVPPDLERLVSKTLRKDREERYQTVSEFVADLKALNHKLDRKAITGNTNFRITDGSTRAQATEEALKQSARQSLFPPGSISEMLLSKFKLPRKGSMLTLVIIGLALLTAVIGFYKLTGQPAESFQNMRLAKLTSTGDAVGGNIAISPDGKYVVYAVDETGRQSLWVKQVETSGNVQIIPPAEVEFRGLTFSPDGNYIYFNMGPRNSTAGIYKIPVLGGNSRKLVMDADLPVSFSPDGSQIVFLRNQTSLMIANSDGGEVQTLAIAADGNGWSCTAWSPDGEKIVASRFSPADASDHLVEVAVKDGTVKPLAVPPWLSISGVVWLADGKGLILSGRDLETQLSQLWFVPYPDGAPRRITNDLTSYQGLSLTADGKTVVSVQENRLLNIWASSDTNPSFAKQLTTEVGNDDGMSGLSWTPDGRIVYTTRVKGRQDLWIVDADGGNNQQLTFNVKSNFSPAVSPDGRYIVFVSDRSGNLDLWRTDLDGSNAFQLTKDSSTEIDPAFSPDDKWIVYGYADADNKITVRKIDINGGNPVLLTAAEAARPVVSPDGKYIACLYYIEMGTGYLTKIAIIPSEGGLPLKVLDLPQVVKSRTLRWTPDGQGLIYIDSGNRVFNLWSQPLDGSPPKQLTDFKSDQIFRFDLSRNGKGFALARGKESADVVLINNFR
ncbi:MAG TPA: protein kinase [Pyrinomonadaceae bacterium]|jgi:serine/threonine protein kinase/Tol biopolymer transport system component